MAQKVKTNKGLSLQAVKLAVQGLCYLHGMDEAMLCMDSRQRLQLYGRNARPRAAGAKSQKYGTAFCGDTVPRNIGACNRVCPQRRRQYVGTVRGDPQEILQPDSPAVRTAGKYIVTH